ncbi:HD domain-containing protein [Patescibacteria group bacterium]|nr:MAG: HD domain-containing protein [Patescibacteria group bacterium]
MSTELVKKTAEYVRKKMTGDPAGNDWFHLERVWKLSKRLQAKEGGDLELVELSALLHDLGDYKQFEFDQGKGHLILHGMMDILEIDDARQEQILHIVENAHYKGDGAKAPDSIEGKIVQDADWLDALGAIGIARVCAFGGRVKRVLHDPAIKPRKRLSQDEYQRRRSEGTTYNQFFERILKLPKLMNTKTARKLAEKKAKFTQEFLKNFDKEWSGEF